MTSIPIIFKILFSFTGRKAASADNTIYGKFEFFCLHYK